MKKLFCPQNENNVARRVLFQSAKKHGDNTSAEPKNFEANASFVNQVCFFLFRLLVVCVIFFTHGCIHMLQNSKFFINLEPDEENLIHKAQVNKVMSLLLNLFYENYVHTSFCRYFFVPTNFSPIFVLFDMQKSPEVLFLKENSLKHKPNKMCSGADELCNVNFMNV
jgi:hypothetical protein